jgi:hypothetical protein
MFGDWYFLPFTISQTLVIFFLENFCWVEKIGRDVNEKSLDLMVILFLFFMNIICVQIPSGKLYQAFLHK